MQYISSTQDHEIKIDYPLSEDFDNIEVRIHSERNSPVARLSDTSPLASMNEVGLSHHDDELYFPMCDIVVVPGLTFRFHFAKEDGRFCFNTGYCKKTSNIKHIVEIDSGEILAWENDLYVSDSTNEILSCYLVKKCYPVAYRLIQTFQLLSPWFEGDIELIGFRDGQEKALYTQHISSRPDIRKSIKTTENPLTADLMRIRNYLLNSQNKNSGEFTGGGLYLFYDADSKAYRAGHWNWTWGVAIEFALEYQKHVEADDKLLAMASSLGDTMLRFQAPAECPNKWIRGVGMGRWQNAFGSPHCTIGYYSVADSGFSSRWGLSTLHRQTGDSRYFDFFKRLSDAAILWLDSFDVIPSDYQEDCDEFTPFTLDETMFGTGIFQVMYGLTGDDKYKEYGKKYIDSMIQALYLGGGCWARQFIQKGKHNSGFMHDTKGHGWATDGLLCAYELTRDEYYLGLAEETALFVGRYQNEDGSFYNFSACEDTGGIGEKSTALWSWLYFRLYELTGKTIFKRHGDRALAYLHSVLGHGDDDPFLEGALVACSVQSGIIYRPYFRMSCAYSSAFMGLAIMKKMEVENQKVE